MNHTKAEYYSILSNVYSRIESEKNWCRDHMAEDKSGRPVPENHSKACRYCLLGAISLECFKFGESDYEGSWSLYSYIVLNLANFIEQKVNWNEIDPAALSIFSQDSSEATITMFNDTLPHSDILSLLRRFIKEWKLKNNFKG